LAQAEGAHVGPDFFDVVETFLFGADFLIGAPAPGDFFVFGPDRVAFFVADDDSVEGFGGLGVGHFGCLVGGWVGSRE